MRGKILWGAIWRTFAIDAGIMLAALATAFPVAAKDKQPVGAAA